MRGRELREIGNTNLRVAATLGVLALLTLPSFAVAQNIPDAAKTACDQSLRRVFFSEAKTVETSAYQRASLGEINALLAKYRDAAPPRNASPEVAIALEFYVTILDACSENMGDGSGECYRFAMKVNSGASMNGVCSVAPYGTQAVPGPE